MNARIALRSVTICMLPVVLALPAQGQVLYSQNFDVDDTLNWTVNVGPTDEHANFFFNYATVGIPSAPGAGGTTRGMKLQANLTDGVFAGFSVSPTGRSFSGDYKLIFNLWSNYLGNEPSGVGTSANGSTMLSTYGILTSGTRSNYPGSADGVYFANTGDGGSAFDYRAYSSERNSGYLLPRYEPEDEHATYHADSQNSSAVLYASNFGGVTVPAGQTALFPETQLGTTPAGALGFEWHEVEIAKLGSTVTWKVDGILLVTVQTAEFIDPDSGSNILFGHCDTNGFVGTDPYYDDVAFTLIDNIRVVRDSDPTTGDYNNNGVVDAADYTVWRDTRGSTTNFGADGNGDGTIDAVDYGVWRANFGRTLGSGSMAAVPEPASWALGFMFLVGVACVRCRRQSQAKRRIPYR